MGAIMNFRIAAVVFGAFDPEAGCCVSRCELSCGMTNINIPYVGGIREEECRNLLTAFSGISVKIECFRIGNMMNGIVSADEN